MDYKNRHHNSE